MARKLWITTSAAVLLWCSAAHAQTVPIQSGAESGTQSGDEQATTLADVVVTAERRTTSLQTAPVAAAVLSGAELQSKGVTNIEQLQFATPSVTFQNQGQGASFNIRGIGKTEGSAAVGVGVITYRDGVAVFPAYFQAEPFFDIASLEVLRGPQGTFAGQNATGGAVFITERNPDFNGFGGYVTAQYGNYNDIRVQGAVNLPITDTLVARIAVDRETRDGFFEIRGTPSKGEPGVLDSSAARFSLLWTPNDQFRVLFKTDYSYIDQGGYPTSPIFSPLPLHTVETNGPFLAKDETSRSVLNISYVFDNGITLRSITGYQKGTTAVQSDLDGTAALPFFFKDRGIETVKSEEINLISPDEGRLRWIVGAYYQHDTILYPTGEFINNQGFDTVLQGINPKRTVAGFGQVSYDLTSSLELQVGARYSSSVVRNDALATIPLFGVALTQHDKATDEKATGKIALNWTIDPNNFVYGFVATGHKAGGLNGPNLAFLPPAPFDSEEVTDFELGWKSTMLDGHLRTQLGAYYDVYKGFQISIGDPNVPALSSILNVTGDTKIYGLEASAQGRFGPLAFDAGLSVSHSELGDFFAADPRRPRTGVCNQTTGPTSGNCVNLAGNPQSYAPELTANFGVEYNFSLGQATLTPRVDYSHISETQSTIFANEALGDKLKSRDIVNAQLTYATGDWSLQAYSTNLGDLEYISSVKSGQRYAAPPRQYGIRLTKNF
jgi:iron complex outermembrane receptor protein